MDEMNQIVARNIKRLRNDKSLSLDELSRLSGVSKSMLAQIERGDGNPTITTLWKISNGMSVPFDSLTVRENKDVEIVDIADIEPVLEAERKIRHYTVFPDDGLRHFAVYYLEVDEEGYWQSAPHLKGTLEYVTVSGGILEIVAGGETFRVERGLHVKFRGDVEHSYRNVGSGTVTIHMILANPEIVVS